VYSPFDEMTPSLRQALRVRRAWRALSRFRRFDAVPNLGAATSLMLGALAATRPPSRGAFARALRQMDLVERHVAERHAAEAAFARSAEEVRRVRESGRVALVHCLEGAFHLPPAPRDIPEAMATLARRGVAYVTIAHLYPRGIASVAPAIPYFPDETFRALVPQQRAGLSQRARTAIEAAVREGVLVDLAHMSDRALAETFELLDRIDPERSVPVIASHVGYRFGGQEYNLADWAVAEIAARGGVVGLIFAGHQLGDGVDGVPPAALEDSIELLGRHVDAIAAAAGGDGHVAIGSDLGGFIDPLPGLDDVACYPAARTALATRHDEATAARIAGGNAERVLLGG
jgi:microsomal dipeptidase-like Zn-dependent dipeptidase